MVVTLVSWRRGPEPYLLPPPSVCHREQTGSPHKTAQYILFLRDPDGKRLAVRTVVPMNIPGSCDRKSCRLAYRCWRFGITCYSHMHLQGCLGLSRVPPKRCRPTWGSSEALVPGDPPERWYLRDFRNVGTSGPSERLVPEQPLKRWYPRIV
jgi:hypothetical protein